VRGSPASGPLLRHGRARKFQYIPVIDPSRGRPSGAAAQSYGFWGDVPLTHCIKKSDFHGKLSEKEGVKRILPLGCLHVRGREEVTFLAVGKKKRITGKQDFP